jgi:glycosyltransferase involved in cell wall biosynthesis
MVPSRDSAAVACRLYGLAPERVAVVPEALDVAAWHAGLARAAGRPQAGRVVLCVARMYPRKRLGDLLEAAALLRGRVPGVQVRVVGRGPEWEAVRRLRDGLGLAETVALLGDVSREALWNEYAGAQVFCLPSVQEGFGIVFLEAMAAGLPIVACRTSAVPEVVEDGRTGVLVPPRDPAALAGALAALLGDPARRRALGEAGGRAVAAYTPERVAARFLGAVESLLGHR